MTFRLASYLGQPIDDLLRAVPFSNWPVLRSADDEPAISTAYVFVNRGLEVHCDDRDAIKSVFVQRGPAEYLVEVPFAFTRAEVLQRLGTPESSRGAVRIAGIGERGPSDRFTIPEGLVHLEYRTDADAIEMITFMRSAP